MNNVVGWYLKGIDFENAPASMRELQDSGARTELQKTELLQSAKWEPLIQGKRHRQMTGWVALEELATFRRGIATGANGYFLLSCEQLDTLGINQDRCLPCVGRASDVKGLIYDTIEFESAVAAGAKLFLLNLMDPLTEAEQRYVKSGEDGGLTSRFLLKARRPWYSMEQRKIAPIWSAVFGRGDLKFVFNEAGVRNLTNFHCVYPKSNDTVHQRALTLCLNSATSRASSKLHGRVYGGGLNKFEPNDLKAIQVPDLRQVPKDTLVEMANLLSLLNTTPNDLSLHEAADAICNEAGAAASRT